MISKLLDQTCPASKAINFRICLGFALLVNFLVPLGRLKEFYSNQGYFSNEFIQQTFSKSFSVFFINDSIWTVYLIYLLGLLAIILFIKGIAPRAMAILILLINISFASRDPIHLYGAHSVLFNVLALAIFCDLKPKSDKTYLLPLLAIKIQLAIIYFGAVVPKLRASDWWQGQYVFSMLNYPNRSYLPFLWLHEYPLIVNLLTYSVLIAELAFGFLVWFKQTRVFMVTAMMVFHIGIFFTYNVVYFSPIMVLLLPIFLSASEQDRFIKWFKNLFIADEAKN